MWSKHPAGVVIFPVWVVANITFCFFWGVQVKGSQVFGRPVKCFCFVLSTYYGSDRPLVVGDNHKAVCFPWPKYGRGRCEFMLARAPRMSLQGTHTHTPYKPNRGSTGIWVCSNDQNQTETWWVWALVVFGSALRRTQAA